MTVYEYVLERRTDAVNKAVADATAEHERVRALWEQAALILPLELANLELADTSAKE